MPFAQSTTLSRGQNSKREDQHLAAVGRREFKVGVLQLARRHDAFEDAAGRGVDQRIVGRLEVGVELRVAVCELVVP